MRDPHTHESRGFGFVTMESPAEADAAIAALNGQDFFGKTMVIEKVCPAALLCWSRRRTFFQARRGRARTPTPGRYYGPPKRHERDRGHGEPFSMTSCSLVFNTVLQVSPRLIECTTLVHTTPVTLAAGMTGTVTEIASKGRDTTIIGPMIGVTTEIDGLGTTTGGFNAFSSRKFPRMHNSVLFTSHKTFNSIATLGILCGL